LWQAYSEPALWSYYAKDGRDGEGGEVQYLEYPVMRMRGVWSANPTDSHGNSLPYNDGTVEEDHVKYIDVVQYGKDDADTSYSYFKCTTAGTTNRPWNGTENRVNSGWSLFTASGDAAFDALIAHSAYIESLSVE